MCLKKETPREELFLSIPFQTSNKVKQMTTPNLAFNMSAIYGANEGSMFLNGPRGLIDSVHRSDMTTFNNYKLLKKQDWDENAYPLQEARADFLRHPREGEMMKNNLGWQWSGDSAAANSIIPMIAPFQPITDAWLWYVKQGENENLHALSYSEVTKISVPDGLQEILRIQKDNETMNRVQYVTEILDKVMRIGARITLGEIDKDSQEASDALMLLLGAVFILERCQFMPSFLNTAVLFYQNLFKPIGQTVRKIAVDEWGVHIPQARFIVKHELKFANRRASLDRVRPILTKLLEEVIYNEVSWNARQFAIGGEQLGLTEDMGADYAYYAGADVADLFSLKPDFKQVLRNPAPIMDSFLDTNREKQASMEGKGVNYHAVHVATTTKIGRAHV